jgi:hypothetical protein
MINIGRRHFITSLSAAGLYTGVAPCIAAEAVTPQEHSTRGIQPRPSPLLRAQDSFGQDETW